MLTPEHFAEPAGSFRTHSVAEPFRSFYRYGGAVVAVAAAAGLRWLLYDVLDPGRSFITFYPAVALVAIFAGGWPGVLATLLSAVVVAAWFPFGMHGVGQQVALGLYITSGLIISNMAELLRRARQREVAGLTEQVAERTSHLQQAHARVRQETQDRQQAEKVLHESEERFRKVFDHAATGIAITDWEGRFERCNPSYSALLGYTEQELCQIDFSSLIHPEDREANLAAVRHLKAGAKLFFEIENRYLHKNGEPVWVHKFVSILPDEEGNPAHLMALVTDITRSKQAEEALRESEQWLRLATKAAKIGVFDWNIQTGVNVWTPQLEAIYGLATGEFGRTQPAWEQLIHPGDRASAVAKVEETLATGEPVEHEWRVVWHDGSVHWISGRFQAFKDAAGKPLRLTGVNIDITARKRSEHALRESQQRFRLMADAAPVLIWMSGTDKLCTWFNKSWLDFVGRPIEQELGNGWADNVHADDYDRCLTTYVTAFDAREPFRMEYRLRRHDGEYRWVLDSGIPRYGAGDEFAGYIGSCIDITDRKHTEEALQAVLDTAADAIITINQRGAITSVNPATERMFGYTQDELIGQNVSILMPRPYRDEHDGYLERYLQTGEARIVGIGREAVGRRKDGSCFPVDLAVSETKDQGFTGIIRDISQRKELQKYVLEIAVEEQRRIGQELHDGTGQELTGLTLLASTLSDLFRAASGGESNGKTTSLTDGAYKRAEQISSRLLRGLAEANKHVQQLSHGIMPVQVDAQGLRSALNELATSTNGQQNISCCFACRGAVEIANNTTATHFYRIAQEALNNALRHSQADQIGISLVQQNDRITLEVSDNGIGFDPGASRTGTAGGIGLRAMEYRAGMIGGTLHVERSEKGGTIVRCDVPLGVA
jgi:PAS domain S-box-containing protein